MYAESTPVNTVAAVDVFSVGDFNRDGVVNQADIALFKSELTVRGVQKTNSSDLKYDLNGNGAVDWKDVKVLQQFYNIPNGDSNMDQSVDYTDLNTEYADYGQTSDTWVQGDFTGDNIVNYADLLVLAQNFTAARPTISYIDANYTGQFQTDALTAFGLVPEPSSIAVIGGGLAMLRRASTTEGLMMLPLHKSVRAFTLIELLVVIGIIAVLIGILLPTLSRARQSANFVACKSNLAQIGLATRMYANDFGDHYPDMYTVGGWVFRRGYGETDPADPTAFPKRTACRRCTDNCGICR